MTVLVLQGALSRLGRRQHIGDAGDGRAELAGELGADGGQPGDVPAVPVHDQDVAEAGPQDRGAQVAQQRVQRAQGQAEGAAKGHVVLGQAAPDRRGEHDGVLRLE